ncbi:MAG: hypothetical protein HY060_01910 [Proteobacteria bacterium]|nr:hypothetical protein [Pseudomonadota bacterium]
MQREIATWFACPLLRQITRRVVVDEARHVALGRRLLRPLLDELEVEARASVYHRLCRLWHDSARAAARDHGGSVFARVAPLAALAQRWQRQRRALVRLGLVDDGHPAFAD